MSFHGFRARLLDGVRGLANDEFDVRVGDPKNPIDYPRVCAAKMSRAPNFQGLFKTYLEFILQWVLQIRKLSLI